MEKLSEQCRVCLASSRRLESLDTEYERGCSLRVMLTSFCTLQMDDISVMYDNTCKDCSSEILRCYNFKLQCEQNDSLLRKKAQALKYEEVCKNEGECAKREVDITIVKKEVDNNPFYEENKHNVPVKQEAWMKKDDYKNSDDHRSSDDDHRSSDDEHRSSDDDSLKSVANKKDKPKSKKIKKKRGRPFKNESVAKRKKNIKSKKARLIDRSFEKLGYKRVYECYRCGHLCKSFTLVHTHLNKMHSIVLESVEEYEDIWEQERKARGIQDSQEEDKDIEMLDKKNPVYKCIECPHRNADYETMKKHIVEQHREEKFIRCPEDDCQYSTHDSIRFAKHMKLMHRNKNSFSCKECDYKTNNKNSLELHHTIKHLNIKPFACQHCPKEFRSNHSLQNHVAMRHDRKTKFICPTCSKCFYLKRYLKDHMEIHTGVKSHICEHCGKTFLKREGLERHVYIMHTENQDKIIPCPQCSFKAKNIYSLHNHKKIHKERVKLQCDHCEKTFCTKFALKRHIWRHIGYAPLKCPTCPYRCYSTTRLKTHMLRHTGERPFCCQICEFRTITQKQLNAHIETHMNEHKYKCQFCPYTANRSDILRGHLRTKCGTATRKYTSSKSKTATDFTQFNMNHLLAEDSGPSTSVPMDITHMKME